MQNSSSHVIKGLARFTGVGTVASTVKLWMLFAVVVVGNETLALAGALRHQGERSSDEWSGFDAR